MTYLTDTRFGKEREWSLSRSYYRSKTPLSILSQVDMDAGGRTVSNIGFIHLSMSSPVINGMAWVSFHKAKAPCYDALYQNTGPTSNFITADETGVPYRISDDTVIDFKLPNPHLYEMDVHFLFTEDSMIPAEMPEVTAFSVVDDGAWHEVGTQGQLKAHPYRNEGIYYSKKNTSPYIIGQAEGSVLNLGKESGITVLDGEIAVTSRQYQTFLGLQMWLKTDKDSDDVTMELSAGDGTVTFSVSQYDDGGATARFAVGESTLSTKFTLFQDGQRVSVPTIRNGVWTSVGVAFNSPIEPGATVPTLTFGPGITVKDIIFYGGDNLSKIMNFRTWAQIMYANNNPVAWGDLDELTWAELFIAESDVPAMDIGKQYRGTIGTNRYIVGEDEGEESRKLMFIDDGIIVTSKAIVLENGENVTVSTPSWKTVGTYSA